jgi:hypothetical protein
MIKPDYIICTDGQEIFSSRLLRHPDELIALNIQTRQATADSLWWEPLSIQNAQLPKAASYRHLPGRDSPPLNKKKPLIERGFFCVRRSG